MRLEPLTLLGALSAVTSHIGLISTATTTYLDPFHVARMFATLDQMSEGRVGWNVVTSSAASEALNFSHDKHAPHADRYERAAEFIEVAQGLWDTWEDDAFVLDKDDGLFFDPAKMHMLHHKGKHFSVRGPLMVPRSPQGQPVIVQAGQSEAGRELAARTAEVLFTVQQKLEPAREFYADLKARVAKCGRSPDSIKIMPGVLTVVGADAATRPQEKFERLQALIHPELGVPALSDIVGMDLDAVSARRAAARSAADQHAAGPPEGRDGHGAAREPDHPPALQAGRDRARPSRRASAPAPTSPTRWRNGIAAARPTASTSCRRSCRRA